MYDFIVLLIFIKNPNFTLCFCLNYFKQSNSNYANTHFSFNPPYIIMNKNNRTLISDIVLIANFAISIYKDGFFKSM